MARILMRPRTAAALAMGAAGLAVAAALVGHYGPSDVGGALVAVGWSGLAAVCLVRSLAILVNARAWRLFIAEPPSAAAMFCARAVRDGVGSLLGGLPAAGEAAATRCLVALGTRLGSALSSLIVDLATESMSQAAFTAAGLALLAAHRPMAEAAPWIAASALALLTLLSVPLLARSRRVLLLVGALVGAVTGSLAAMRRRDAETLAHDVRAAFARPRRVAASTLLHLLAWSLAALETWLALGWRHAGPSLADAAMLEALVLAAKGALFVVPAGLGVQEGGYVMVGALIGLPPETALALSLLKRARDILLGLPAIAAWQAVEGARWRWRRPELSRLSEP